MSYVLEFFHIEKFRNKEVRGSVALYVAARGVSLDVGFGPQHLKGLE